MALGTAEIKVEEYAELLKLKGRVDAFIDFVRKEKYGIEREECAAILGFDLEVKDDGADRE